MQPALPAKVEQELHRVRAQPTLVAEGLPAPQPAPVAEASRHQAVRLEKPRRWREERARVLRPPAAQWTR